MPSYLAGRLKITYPVLGKDCCTAPLRSQHHRSGYKLPFLSEPSTSWAKNSKSSLNNREFVKRSIAELLALKCIKEVQDVPYCCNPLTVAGNPGEKLRLVLDLHQVNEYISPSKFRYEDLRTFAQLFEQGDYFFTFDLKYGYHHVEVHGQFKKYLGFSWPHRDGTVRYYVFLVVRFGLNVACYVFTKLFTFLRLAEY